MHESPKPDRLRSHRVAQQGLEVEGVLEAPLGMKSTVATPLAGATRAGPLVLRV
jgi:hypothetical protein